MFRSRKRSRTACTSAAPQEHLAELDATIERLERLGGTVAWEEEFPPEVARVYRNVVLHDVEDNEFCLSGGTLPGSSAQPP